MSKKFGASLSNEQFKNARRFEAAGLCSISQAVKALERNDNVKLANWFRELPEAEAKKRVGIADQYADKYVDASVIESAGGVWNEKYTCFEFPDGTAGRFTDIRNGASERDAVGQPMYHFMKVYKPL